MQDQFSFSSSALPPDTRVLTFTGTESLSRLYCFDIHLLLPHGVGMEFDMGAALQGQASLSILHDSGMPRGVFHGVLSALELVADLPEHVLYRALLVPRLSRLKLTCHSRVFVNESVPSIIEDVLKGSGLAPGEDYVLKLSRPYKPLEHVCQYRESNLDFISRWMEREGLYYFFEQGSDRERLVITDHRSTHQPLTDEPVKYFPRGKVDHAKEPEALRAFTCRHSALPAQVRLKDYNYLNPALDVLGAAPVSSSGVGEIHSYGEHVLSPLDGRRLAEVRAQELLARQVLYQARGRVFSLRPGYTFQLDGHPRSSFNAEYLATEVTHQGNQFEGARELESMFQVAPEETYHVEAVAIPASVQFRSERTTETPRIYGLEPAVVDGEGNSDYAQLDEHGRYSLKLMFDESDRQNGQASTRVRMLQPHGGSKEGFHFPLRKGTEVLVAFLGGDPDRPVITGVAPNPLKPSPVSAANATLNVLQTGGENRLEIEDTAGSQYVKWSTPHKNTMIHLGAPHNPTHNIQAQTDGNCRFAFGTDWDVTVGGREERKVTGEAVATYASSHSTEIAGDVKETLKSRQTTEVHGDVTAIHRAQQLTEVHGDVTESYKARQTTEVGGDATLRYKGKYLTEVGGDIVQNIGGQQILRVEGDVKEEYANRHDVHVKGKQKTVVDGQMSQVIYKGMAIEAHAGFSLNAELATWALGLSLEAIYFKLGIGFLKFDQTDIGITMGDLKADLGKLRLAKNDIKLGMAYVGVNLELLTVFI